jgi:hypothetical protein
MDIIYIVIEDYWMVYWYTPQDCTSAGNMMIMIENDENISDFHSDDNSDE